MKIYDSECHFSLIRLNYPFPPLNSIQKFDMAALVVQNFSGQRNLYKGSATDELEKLQLLLNYCLKNY